LNNNENACRLISWYESVKENINISNLSKIPGSYYKNTLIILDSILEVKVFNDKYFYFLGFVKDIIINEESFYPSSPK